MNFNIESASFDRKIYYDLPIYEDKANLLTVGLGSYIAGFDMSLYKTNANIPNILIGRFSSLSEELYFASGGNHDYKKVSSFPFDMKGPVEKTFGANVETVPYQRPNHFQFIIGHDVWFGRGVTIMGGVKIGNGAVIGSNAVVAKNIPPYAIVVGNPARVIKYRFDAETIKKFLAVKWWNWSLEKIADNFPLMNDVEKFLATHYSPELENFPEDELSPTLEEFIAAGYRVYHFIADFQTKDPLWRKVVQNFCQSNFKTSLLVIWLDKDSTERDVELLSEATQLIGNDAFKNILVVKAEGGLNFSPRALRQGTHFITTCEMSTLEVLDYLWDTDVKIISALDDDIFNE